MGGVRTWRARRVAAHIAACPSCSALGRQLGQVTAVLAAVPPPPLPGDIARRLDAALAAEVAARVASGSALPEAGVPAAVPSGSSVRREPVVPGGQRWRRPPGSPRWRVPRPAPVLAALALCLVLAGGGYLISQSGGTSSVSTSSAAGQTAQAPHHMSAAAGAMPDQVGPAGPRPAGPSYRVRSTNTDYLPATLRAQAQSELSTPPAGNSPSYALQACVIKVAGNDTPSFVDLARYQGRPATIIVARDHAWVTSWGCNATQHGVLDSVSLSGG
jgi:hypothetical protein